MTGTDTTDAVGRAASAADPGGLMRAYEAASMYYVQGETMEVIAHHLRVSRSTVSRLLARARQEGVVRVTLVQPGGAGSLEGRMTQAFGVRTHIVPVREGTTEIHRLQQVASVAAAHMVDLIEALAEQAGNGGPQVQDPAGSGGEGSVQGRGSGGVVVGVAWGTTMSEVSAALPSRSVPGLTVVQLNGASDPVREGPSAGEVLSRMRLSLGARTISFPVPAFFDHVRGGDGGDLLEAVDLRGALAHRDDMRADPEDLRHPPLQGAGATGLDQADPYDALLAGTRQEPGDGGAGHSQVVGDHLHRLALDVVHGGRLVGAQEATGVGGTRRAPDGVRSGSASHVILLLLFSSYRLLLLSTTVPFHTAVPRGGRASLPDTTSDVPARRTVRTDQRTFLWIPQKPSAH